MSFRMIFGNFYSVRNPKAEVFILPWGSIQEQTFNQVDLVVMNYFLMKKFEYTSRNNSNRNIKKILFNCVKAYACLYFFHEH